MNEYALLKQAVMMKLAAPNIEKLKAVRGRQRAAAARSAKVGEAASGLKMMRSANRKLAGPGRADAIKGAAGKAPSKTMSKLRRMLSSAKAHGKASWKLGKGKHMAAALGAAGLAGAGYGAYRYNKKK